MVRNSASSVRPVSDFVTSPGSRTHVIYEPRFDGRQLTVNAVGSEDIQERIESYAPYTDLNYMLQRLSVGDTSVCAKSSPMYGDFSGLPDNPVDAINLIHNAETNFSLLPADEKALYNNDFRRWLADRVLVSGSPDPVPVRAPEPVPAPADVKVSDKDV